MVAISFKPEWREKLLSGKKTQTIRPYNEKRAKQIEKTEKLQIYINQRSPNNEFLFEADLEDIFVVKFPQEVMFQFDSMSPGLSDLAKRDGFKNIDEMVDWFYNQYMDDFFGMRMMVIRFESPIETHPGLGVKRIKPYLEQERLEKWF